MDGPIRIGISACLLGKRVRYDGSHRHAPWITGALGSCWELVGICPEVECGFPTPREPMRLEGDRHQPRLVTVETGVDLTEMLLGWCGRKVRELEGAGLSGFILKEKSPSCGLAMLEVYREGGVPVKTGRGLFANALLRHFPRLPLIEGDALQEAAVRDGFLERVTGYRRRLEKRKQRENAG